MIVCMLPVNEVPVSDHGHSECVQIDGESMPTYCETDGRTVVLSDLVKFVAVDNDMVHRFAEYFSFRAPAPVPLNSPPARHVNLFLFLCTFLK